MAKAIYHPSLGTLIDASFTSRFTGLPRETIMYYENKAEVNKLPWKSYRLENNPNKPWFVAKDVLEYVEQRGGFGGFTRIDEEPIYVDEKVILNPKGNYEENV